MADSTNDPVADVQPTIERKRKKPVVSSPQNMLMILLTHVLIIMYYRAAWYVLEALTFDRMPNMKEYSKYLLILYLAPIGGMLASVFSKSAGTIASWSAMAVSIATIIIMCGGIYVLVVGFPPDIMMKAVALFRTGPSAPLVTA